MHQGDGTDLPLIESPSGTARMPMLSVADSNDVTEFFRIEGLLTKLVGKSAPPLAFERVPSCACTPHNRDNGPLSTIRLREMTHRARQDCS